MQKAYIHSEETGNDNIAQNSSVIEDVTFSSVPTKLNLMSKQMKGGQIALGRIPLLEGYKLSYRHLNRYCKYLQLELSRFSTAKILLKLTIGEYYSCQKKGWLSAKQLSLLVFLFNTLHYINLEAMVPRYCLTCDHYSLQSKIETGQFVMVFGEILPFHLQQLETSKQLYLQKYSQLINIYKQSGEQRASQLNKAITLCDRDIAIAKPVLNSIVSSLPIPAKELIALLKNILDRVKAREAQLQSIADNGSLRVLFLLSKLLDLESKETTQKLASQAQLRQFRNISVKASPQQMIQYLLTAP